MELKEYFRRRAAVIKAAQTRKDRLDSGEADASWESRLQDEWNMLFLEQLETLKDILSPPELPVDPRAARKE